MRAQWPILVALGCVCVAARAEPLTLERLVELARAHDFRVKEAQAQLRVYQATYNQARGAWLPRVESSFLVAGPTPEARNNALGGPPTTAATYLYDLNLGQPGVMLRTELNAVMPIYTFGKLSAAESAGKAGVEVGQALTVAAEDEAEFQVSQAYYAYCLALEAGKIVADTIQQLDAARDTVARLSKQGSDQVNTRDAYKLEYFRQQVLAQRAAAETGASVALASIRVLIGSPADAPIQVIARTLAPPSGVLASLSDYVAQAGGTRPELRALAAGVRANEKLSLLQSRMYFPDIGLAMFFRYAWTSSATPQLTPFAYDPFNELSVGVALVLRYTWDFHNKRSALDLAQAQLTKVESQRDFATAGARLQIEKAWNETQAALSRSDHLAIAVQNAQRWAQAALIAFDLGTTDTREIVDALTALATSSAQRGQAQFEVRQGLLTLSRAIGSTATLKAAP